MFAPFRNLSNKGTAVAVVACVVLSGVLYKLEEHEKAHPEQFRKKEDLPWRKEKAKDKENDKDKENEEEQ